MTLCIYTINHANIACTISILENFFAKWTFQMSMQMSKMAKYI